VGFAGGSSPKAAHGCFHQDVCMGAVQLGGFPTTDQEDRQRWQREQLWPLPWSHQELCCGTVWRSSQFAVMCGRRFPLEIRQLVRTSPIRISVETPLLALQHGCELESYTGLACRAS